MIINWTAVGLSVMTLFALLFILWTIVIYPKVADRIAISIGIILMLIILYLGYQAALTRGWW